MKRIIFKGSGPFVNTTVESEAYEFDDDVTDEELNEYAMDWFFNEGFEYWFEIVED